MLYKTTAQRQTICFWSERADGMQLVNLGQYRKQEVVSAARKLLAMAESGELKALCFVAKLDHADHGAGLAGDYKRHPEQALPALLQLKELLSGTGPARGRLGSAG